MAEWNSVRKKLPKKSYQYLVYVHAPDDVQNTILDIEDENGEPIDWGFIAMAYFNKAQGGIWQMEYDNTAYGSDLSKIDTAKEYYISHWMDKPEKPKDDIFKHRKKTTLRPMTPEGDIL